MGIGKERMLQLIADLAGDPNALVELTAAVTTGNVAINAAEIAERSGLRAREDLTSPAFVGKRDLEIVKHLAAVEVRVIAPPAIEQPEKKK